MKAARSHGNSHLRSAFPGLRKAELLGYSIPVSKTLWENEQPGSLHIKGSVCMAIRPLSELAPYAVTHDSMHVVEDVFFCVLSFGRSLCSASALTSRELGPRGGCGPGCTCYSSSWAQCHKAT